PGLPLRCDGRLLLVLLKRAENELADLVLRGRIHDRAQQCKAAPLAIDDVLTRGEGDVAPVAASPLPDRESDQLEAGQRTVREVQLRFAQLSSRGSLVVQRNLD